MKDFLNKIISLVLVVIFIASSGSCYVDNSKKVYADETDLSKTVVSIQYISNNKWKIIENTHGSYIHSVYNRDWYFNYNIRSLLEVGDVLVVNYNDDTKKEYSFDGERTFRSAGGEQIDYYDVKFDSTQDKEHWVVNGLYEVTIQYEGAKTSRYLTIVADSVTDIEFELANPIVIEENTGGEIQNDFYYYFFDYSFIKREGNKYVFHFLSGKEKEYIYDSSKEGFFDESGSRLNGMLYYHDAVPNQNEEHWVAGETYKFEFIAHEHIFELPVTISAAKQGEVESTTEADIPKETTAIETTTEADISKETTAIETTTEADIQKETTAIETTTEADIQKETTAVKTTTEATTANEIVIESVQKPTLKSATKKKNKAKITLALGKKINGIKGYEIRFYKSKNAAKKNKNALAKITVASRMKNIKVSVKKIRKRKNMFVRVRGYKTVNGIRIYSNWSNIKKVETKTALY
ncbi:MAG: hypothetical protein K6G88_07750 [Lachnospiraceae bacterium]|nr:hypothetical protein [Lachnospiraceae bacterium]